MKPRSTPSASKRLSLIEASLALVLTLVIFGLIVSAVRGGSSTLSVSQLLTAAQQDAERCAGLVRRELISSGLGPDGNLTLSSSTLQGPLVNDTVTYAPLESYDPADPLNLTWGERRVVRFEADGAENPTNGVDDDGDGLVDEGAVVLVSDATGARIAVLARDVTGFVIELDPGGADALPKVTVSVTVSRIIQGASDAGSPAKNTHTALAMVTLLN